MLGYDWLLAFLFLAVVVKPDLITQCPDFTPISEISTLADSTAQVCIVKLDDSKSWNEAAYLCNEHSAFLIYAFEDETLQIIFNAVGEDLLGEYSSILAVPAEEKTIFVSAHDKFNETVVMVDMPWLKGVEESFSAPVDVTGSTVERFQSKLPVFSRFIWSIDSGGKMLPGSVGNTEDKDCVAHIVSGGSGIHTQWINCNTNRSRRILCRRDGDAPCSIQDSFRDLTHTQYIGIAIIQSAGSILYAAEVENGFWLTEEHLRRFMLPDRHDLYMLALCEPGWFVDKDRKFDMGFKSCLTQINTTCAYWDGCSLFHNFRGTSIERCNSHGYCRSRLDNGGVGVTYCECLQGYYGDSCENSTNICESNPCGEGSICHQVQHDYYCECVGGYSINLHSCQYSIKECESNPCRNNATCDDTNTGFTCICPELARPGDNSTVYYENGSIAFWEGQFCDLDPINDCESNPCVGLHPFCWDRIGGFHCVCDVHRHGDTCEVEELVRSFDGPGAQVLIVCYVFFFILFNAGCMALTIARKREIDRGIYETEEMVIARHETQKNAEREKLMQYVEEAAYSSDSSEENKIRRSSDRTIFAKWSRSKGSNKKAESMISRSTVPNAVRSELYKTTKAVGSVSPEQVTIHGITQDSYTEGNSVPKKKKKRGVTSARSSSGVRKPAKNKSPLQGAVAKVINTNITSRQRAQVTRTARATTKGTA